MALFRPAGAGEDEYLLRCRGLDPGLTCEVALHATGPKWVLGPSADDGEAHARRRTPLAA